MSTGYASCSTVFSVPIQCSEAALDGTQSAGQLQQQQEVKHTTKERVPTEIRLANL